MYNTAYCIFVPPIKTVMPIYSEVKKLSPRRKC